MSRSASESYNPNLDKALPMSPGDNQISRSRSDDVYASARAHLSYELIDAHNEPPPPTPPKIPVKDRQVAKNNIRRSSSSSTHPVDRIVVLPDMDPHERARRRMEAQLKQKLDEEESFHQEALRQARIRAEREEQMRRDVEDERRRKLVLEQELQQSITLRRQRKEEERMEAEAWARELERRKREEKEKRLAHGRRLEAWRKEEAARVEEAASREEEEMREMQRRRARAKLDARKLRKEKRGSDEVISKGWVTIQTNQSPVWKRRYFQLTASRFHLYKTEDDLTRPLDVIKLDDRVRAVCEWNEGFEELEAIPHSFAVVFADEQKTISMFTDSDHEKDVLMGFFSSSI
ncbi:hypothetical protein EW146_g4260 [Bondarzewia mesenterica]|uniref:PH domain-containing protein n=1 Tax=Bondarzewia mesenterica TaxID=1095465 RepID=A0A4V3XF70_9AGAM|nr:hypothetical protein EW146_g4260 [Bondarzewia mesenterica]